MQNLQDKARDIVIANNVTDYRELNDYQKDTMTAQLMRDLKKYAYEQITNSNLIDTIAAKTIEALEETHFADRNVLLKEIGALVLEAAREESKSTIDSAINESASSLSLNRQLNNQIMNAYNKQQARDMNLAVQGR